MITDDHIMVINGLQNSLRNYDNIEVTGTFRTGNALMEALKSNPPDVLLLDIQLPDATGDELAPIILKEYPYTQIIVLTALESSFHLKDMIQMGCKGYLLKTNTDQDLLISAIERVYNGEVFIEPSLKEEMMHTMLHTQNAKPHLTIREKEILQLTAHGLTSQEIADKLCLSKRTIDNHRANIFQKFDVKNTTLLLRKAVEFRLINE